MSTSNRAHGVAPRSRHSQPASFERARRAVVALDVLENGESPIQVAGDDERVGAEAIVGDDLARDRGEQCLEPSTVEERQGPRAGIADRVHRAAIAERPPGAGDEPASPVERSAVGRLLERQRCDRRADAAQPVRQLGRQQPLALGCHRGVGAKGLAGGRRRNEHERRGTVRLPGA